MSMAFAVAVTAVERVSAFAGHGAAVISATSVAPVRTNVFRHFIV
jgi:hypothetical protein